MCKLMNEFDEKTVLGLWWDSKVPEKDKVKEWSKFWKMPFTNISFLGVSDSEEVIEEIKKYFKLYGEIEEIAQEVSQVVEQEGINAAEPQINALRVKLQEAIKEAKNEKECVSSSAVFNAHMGLISEQEKVIGKLTSVQLGVSQERGFSLTKKLEKSENLSEGYRRQFDTVLEENQEIKRDSREIKQENQEIKQQLATLTRQMQRMMQNQAPSSSLSEVDPISAVHLLVAILSLLVGNSNASTRESY